MSPKELHYQFKLNLDRVDSLANPDLNPAEIDWLLNEAQLIFIKQRMGMNNQKRSGFETSQKRIDDLGNLVIKFPTQPPITPVEVSPGIFEVNLKSTLYPYMFLVTSWADVEVSPDCLKKTALKFTQHDDFTQTFKDPYNNASLEFIPYNIGRNSTNNGQSIYMYTTQTIPNVYVEYIKLPSKVSLGNYTYIDGIVYPPTTLETAEHTHKEIVDLACQLAAQNTQNPEYVQLRNQKLLINE